MCWLQTVTVFFISTKVPDESQGLFVLWHGFTTGDSCFHVALVDRNSRTVEHQQTALVRGNFPNDLHSLGDYGSILRLREAGFHGFELSRHSRRLKPWGQLIF
jgi:hypothetical protein